jgi:hypothetical protein
MSKVTITLEVTYEQLFKIAEVLQTTTPRVVTEQAQLQPVVVPPAPKPGGKTAPKLPAFGRTQAQIDSYIEYEKARVASLDEKAEEKLMKKQQQELAEQEVIKITEVVIYQQPAMPAKFWNL